MLKKPFGKTGVDVTVLGHGAMEIRGPRIWNGRPVTDDEAETILNAVLDAGINFIDTAPDYGLSEEYIGKFISKRRDEYILATKCGCHVVEQPGEPNDKTEHHWNRETLMGNIELSLKRMKVDYVDFLQLHNPSVDDAEKGDLVRVLEDIKKSGKAKHIGISSSRPDIDKYIEWGVFESFQIPYSALERLNETAITAAHKSGAGTIVRGGVAKGEPGKGRGREANWKIWEAANLNELLEEGETPTGFLLRFTITHPDMNTTIVGTKRVDHLHENLKALEKGPLSDEVYNEVKKRVDAVK